MSSCLRKFAVCIVLGATLSSCSTMGNEARAARRMDVKISPDDETNPKRIRFDLYRTPYAEEQDQRLPVHEQIRLGMRKFASEQLAARGYCPNGFKGPEKVYVPENDIEHSFFYVDCLPPAR